MTFVSMISWSTGCDGTVISAKRGQVQNRIRLMHSRTVGKLRTHACMLYNINNGCAPKANRAERELQNENCRRDRILNTAVVDLSRRDNRCDPMEK
jgi:hypothetical protein